MSNNDVNTTIIDIFGKDGRIWNNKPKINNINNSLITILRNLHYNRIYFQCVTISNNNNKILSVDQRGTIILYHILENRYHIINKCSSICCYGEIINDKYIAIGCVDHHIRIININNGQIIKILKGHQTSVTKLYTSYDKQWLLSMSQDCVMVWKITNSFKHIFTHRRNNSNIRDVKFGIVSHIILICYDDNCLELCDITTSKIITKYTCENISLPHRTLLSCAISKNGRYIIAGGRFQQLILWDGHTNQLMGMISLPKNVTRCIQLEFIGTSHIIAILCDNNTIYFYNIEDMRIISIINSSNEYIIRQLSFNHNGQHLVTLYSNGYIGIYDVKNSFLESSKNNNNIKLPKLKFIPISKLLSSKKNINNTNSSIKEKNRKKKKIIKNTNNNIIKENLSMNNQKNIINNDNNICAHNQPLPQLKINSDLSTKKLKKMLKKYNSYPKKHRLLIWRFLQRLPENCDAFRTLKDKGIHDSSKQLIEKYPLKNQNLSKKLLNILSCLAHWSPIFGEIDYLPAIIFPFVALYFNYELAAFEICMSFIMNYTYNWFECFPNPPIPLLQKLTLILKYHDNELCEHLENNGITIYKYIWCVLSTLFTDVLSQNDWLTLMDHILSNDVDYLYYALIAYFNILRNTLLSGNTPEDFQFFLDHQHSIPINSIIDRAYQFQSNTPYDLHPLNKNEGIWKPLSINTYPLFIGIYPKYMVDFQSQERERIKMEEEEMNNRRNDLNKLIDENKILLSKQEKWHQQQQILLQEENERRHKWLLDEENRANERNHLTKVTNEQRVNRLKLLEQTAQEYMIKQKKVRESELQRLDDEIKRREYIHEQFMKEETHNEKLRQVEFEMQQRMMAIEAEKDREEMLRTIRASNNLKTQEKEVATQLLKAQWKREDDEKLKRLEMLKIEAKEKRKLHSTIRDQRIMEQKLALEKLSEEVKQADMLGKRAIRHVEMNEVIKRENKLAQEARRLELLSKEEQLQEHRLLNKERQRLLKRQKKREELLENLKQKANNQLKNREDRLNNFEKKQRNREFQSKMKNIMENVLKDELERETKLHEQLTKLEEEKARDRRLDLQLAFKEQEMKEKQGFLKVMAEAEERIISEERKRYDILRAKLKDKMTQEDEALIAKHENIMARLIVQRERQLWKLNEKLREGVRSEELANLENEYANHQDTISKMRKQFEEEEQILLAKVRSNITSISDHDDNEDISNTSSSSSSSSSITTNTTPDLPERFLQTSTYHHNKEEESIDNFTMDDDNKDDDDDDVDDDDDDVFNRMRINEVEEEIATQRRRIEEFEKQWNILKRSDDDDDDDNNNNKNDT